MNESGKSVNEQKEFLDRIKWDMDASIRGAEKHFQDGYFDSMGVFRWKTNNRIPPDHCLAVMAKYGKISIANAMEWNEIRKKEDHAFFEKAYDSLPNEEWDCDPETLMEARANCDDDNQTLVNLIGYTIDLKTGKCRKIK